MRVIDIDPSKSTVVTEWFDATSVDLLNNAAPDRQSFVGSGHQPLLIEDGWLPNVPALVFNGSTAYQDLAERYLTGEHDQLFDDVFGCTVSTWKAWTVFVVVRLDQVPAVEAGILNVNQKRPGSYPGTGGVFFPLVLFYADGADFLASVFSDGVASNGVVTLGAVDLAPHVLEFTADGAGNVLGWFDGAPVTGASDVRPKSPGSMTLGAAWAYDAQYPMEQLNGRIARVLVFDEDLSTADRNTVRNQLKALYGI